MTILNGLTRSAGTRGLAWAATAMFLLQGAARAQCPEWSAPFGTKGLDGRVNAMIEFDDGTGPALYVGGQFATAGSTVANNVVRWDGTAWDPIGGVNGEVNAFEVFDDGTGPALYIGGDFSASGGVPMRRVAKWDGTTIGPAGLGLDGPVFTLRVFDDGTGPALFAGGSFDRGIARFAGADWSTPGDGVNGEVHALRVFAEQGFFRLFLGGTFAGGGRGAGLVHSPRVIKWTGTSWLPSIGVGEDVLTFGVMGGFLFAAGKAGDNGVIKLYKKSFLGVSWSVVAMLFTPEIRDLFGYDDGTGEALYAAVGVAVLSGNLAFEGIARWNGSMWSGLRGLDGQGNVVGVFDSGSGPRLQLGGEFGLIGSDAGLNLAEWDGTRWEPLGAGGMDGGDVRALAEYMSPDGPVLVATGTFMESNGVPTDRISQFDGVDWSPLGSGFDSAGEALVVFDDGGGPLLYAGGRFDQAGGVPAASLAAWDGTSWSEVGGGTNNAVFDLAVFDDGTGEALYIGGRFQSVGNGIPAGGVAKWDGTTWSTLGTGTNGVVFSLETFDDGTGEDLYVGGRFESVNGVSAGNIARWDGTSWTPVGSGIEGEGVVCALVGVDASSPLGPNLYIGGDYTIAGGLLVNSIARWNGTQWKKLRFGINGPFGTRIRTMVAFDDGNGEALFIGGQFTQVGLADRALNAARWTGSNWAPMGLGSSAQVESMLVTNLCSFGDAIVVGGQFDMAGPVFSRRLAVWSDPCAPGEGVTYCTGKTNSLGCVPSIQTFGVPSLAAASFRVTAEDVIPGQAGILLYGFDRGNLSFHAGKLCVKTSITRLLPARLAKAKGVAPCTGVLTRNFNTLIQSGSDPMLVPGAVVRAQWLQRDPGDPAGFGDSLTNAVEFVICE